MNHNNLRVIEISTMRQQSSLTFLGLVLAGAAAMGLAASVAAQSFEPAPSLKARDLLPASLVKGPRHEVSEAVKADGFLTGFAVTSSFGTWEAVDREMLDIRVQEVYALDRLSEVSKTEVFAAAFARAAQQKAKAVAHVAADPVGTAKALPGGVARFAKGVGRSVKGAADKVTSDKGDEGKDTRTAEQKTQDAAAAAAESILISGKRREWAAKVGADPYTTNKLLSDKLDDMAWAAYAGGFALNVAIPTVPGLGVVETADKMVYQLPPAELQKRNAEKLKAAGVSDDTRKALFVNRAFTTTLQTELAEAVAALGAATGMNEVVMLAAESKTEGDARYIRRCVQLLAAGAKQAGGWKALTTGRNEIEAVAADGRLVLPWAADYMTWNEETVPEDSPPVISAKAREIWITGVATPRAKQELKTKGFAVVEKRPVR
jgi:hypothetical protein